MAHPVSSDNQFLPIIAPVLTVMAAFASIYFMARASQHQQSIFLISAFTFWVLSPFAGLLWINKISASWSSHRKSRIHWLMIIMTIISVIVYSQGLKPQNAKPAFTFLVFPFVSLVMIIAFFFLSRTTSAKK
jgi:hypothetical protein